MAGFSYEFLANRFSKFITATLFLLPLNIALAAGPDLSVQKNCAVGANQSVLCTITITNIGDVTSVGPLSLTDNTSGSNSIN